MPKQLKFAKEWFDLASSSGVICGAAASVRRSDYRSMQKANPQISMSPFAACLPIIINKLSTSPNVWQLISDQGLAVVLEAGIDGRERGVAETLSRLAQANNMTDQLKFHGTVRKDQLRAVQLADFLAYFSWKQSERAAGETLHFRSPLLDVATNTIATVLVMDEDFHPNPAYPKTTRRAKRLR